MNLDKIYSLLAPKQIFAGENSITNIVNIVSTYCVEEVLIVTDQGVWNTGLIEYPKTLLENSGIKVNIINTVPPEPEINQVEEILSISKQFKSEMIVGIGGGSVMDTAKLIAVLITTNHKVEDILGVDQITKKGLPTIMIPTTAGTGSEATQNAIVTIPDKELKVGIVSSKLMADFVILDPVLTINLPPAITAATGMDALAHALECFISKKANPFSDIFALSAIRLIFANLRKAYADGRDIQARHNMLLASFLGGMCIASSSTTAVHALAYPLGGKYKIPHGVSNAMLLPHVMSFNADAIEDKLLQVAAAVGIDTSVLSKQQASLEVIKDLHLLAKDLNIPTNLKKYGICEDDLNRMVEEASKVTRLLNNNPKTLDKKDIYAIYKKLL